MIATTRSKCLQSFKAMPTFLTEISNFDVMSDNLWRHNSLNIEIVRKGRLHQLLKLISNLQKDIKNVELFWKVSGLWSNEKKSEYINICFPRSFVCKWKRHSRSICSREIELFSMVFRQENYDKKLCVLYFYHFLIYESNSFLRGWSGLTATLIHLRLIPLSWVKVAN